MMDDSERVAIMIFKSTDGECWVSLDGCYSYHIYPGWVWRLRWLVLRICICIRSALGRKLIGFANGVLQRFNYHADEEIEMTE